MFYCDECHQKYSWFDTIMKSFGPCECCGWIRYCNDCPSSLLPETPQEEQTSEEAEAERKDA